MFYSVRGNTDQPESNQGVSFWVKLIWKPQLLEEQQFPCDICDGTPITRPTTAAPDNLNIDRVLDQIFLWTRFIGGLFLSSCFLVLFRLFLCALTEVMCLKWDSPQLYPEVVFFFCGNQQIEKSLRCRSGAPGCQQYRFSTWMQVIGDTARCSWPGSDTKVTLIALPSPHVIHADAQIPAGGPCWARGTKNLLFPSFTVPLFLSV